MTTSANRVFVILGVGFAAYLLMQAAYRNGTISMFDWEWNKTAKSADEYKDGSESNRRLAAAMGLDFDTLNRYLSDDAPMYEQAVKFGANPDTPGVIFNMGGLEGKPYTQIDGEGYYLSGR